jgi:hypothetical protein
MMRRTCWILLAVIVLAPVVLAADVHTGTWKVSSATAANHGVYVNATGATQKVLATWCTTAGGTVSAQVAGADVATVDPGNCSTRAVSLPNNQGVTMHLTSGTSANGTYSISVLP